MITKSRIRQIIREEFKQVLVEMTRYRPRDIAGKDFEFHLMIPIMGVRGGEPHFDYERRWYRGKIVKLPGLTRQELKNPLRPEQPVIFQVEATKDSDGNWVEATDRLERIPFTGDIEYTEAMKDGKLVSVPAIDDEGTPETNPNYGRARRVPGSEVHLTLSDIVY